MVKGHEATMDMIPGRRNPWNDSSPFFPLPGSIPFEMV